MTAGFTRSRGGRRSRSRCLGPAWSTGQQVQSGPHEPTSCQWMSNRVGKALWLLTFPSGCLGPFPGGWSTSRAVPIHPPPQVLLLTLLLVNSASSLPPPLKKSLSSNPLDLQSHRQKWVFCQGMVFPHWRIIMSGCVSLRRSCGLANLCPCDDGHVGKIW